MDGLDDLSFFAVVVKRGSLAAAAQELGITPPAAFDLAIRFGEQLDSRITARKLADNRRFLCASPAYLAAHGAPNAPRDLHGHSCIVLRESDEIYGSWQFRSGTRQETVKMHGPLSTNDGEAALSWAPDGHGIVLRSEWDAAPCLRSGRLQPVLEEWDAAPADIYILFPTKSHLQAKTRAMVDFMLDAFKDRRRTERTRGDLLW